MKLFLIFLFTFCLVQSQTAHLSEFEILKSHSQDELAIKTQLAKGVWGIDKIDRWDLDQDVGDLIFSFADGTKVIAPAQIIGSYYKGDHTWLWAWGNDYVNDKLKKDSLKVKQYGEEHHMEKLTSRKWVGTEEDAWAMAAIAVKLCDEQGAYRGPMNEMSAGFIAFGPVKRVNK